MIENLKLSLLTIMLSVWSTLALAQTAPGGAPGTTTSTGAVGDAGTNWLWIVIAVVVVAGLFYFLGRNRGTRI